MANEKKQLLFLAGKIKYVMVVIKDFIILLTSYEGGNRLDVSSRKSCKKISVT